MLHIDSNFKTIYRFIVFTASLLLVLSCTETFVDDGNYSPKIVVEALFSAGDTIKVDLNSNLSIYDSIMSKTDYYFYHGLSNAQVLLYEDNILCDTLCLKKYCNYYSSTVAKQGVEYKLEVSHNDFPTAIAISRIPLTVKAGIVKYLLESDSTNMKLNIEFQDRAHEENYYAIRVYKMLKGRRQARAFYNIDPLFGDNLEFDNSMISFDSGNKNVFRIDFHDDGQDGQKMNIELLLPLKFDDVGAVNNINVGDTLQVYLYSEGKEIWDFNKSQQIYAQTHSSGAEPTMLYTNVENGVGIFAGYSYVVYSFVYK